LVAFAVADAVDERGVVGIVVITGVGGVVGAVRANCRSIRPIGVVVDTVFTAVPAL